MERAAYLKMLSRDWVRFARDELQERRLVPLLRCRTGLFADSVVRPVCGPDCRSRAHRLSSLLHDPRALSAAPACGRTRTYCGTRLVRNDVFPQGGRERP